MNAKTEKVNAVRPPHARSSKIHRSALCAGLLLTCSGAHALEIDLGVPDTKLLWDTTAKYSNAFRVKSRSATIVGEANQDDGDRNFKRGLISNRVDLYSEGDLTYKSLSARVSAAAWYDSVYMGHTHNDSPLTLNSAGPDFASGTRNTAGSKLELLDAFVAARGDLGDVPASMRIGRHALQWGETLFFANNGIAGGMAPVDAVKAAAVPNSLVREIIRPVGQVSGQAQITPSILLGAYYQYKWEKTRIPAAGSYFSGGDFFDDGGETLILGPGFSIPRMADIKPKDSGQGGLQLKFRDSEHGVDYGVYAIRYHAKAFTTSYVNLGFIPTGAPPPAPPTAVAPVGYQLVYAQNIKSFGASASFTAFDIQWAGEVSTRRNAPLYTNGMPLPPGTVGNNDNDPGYAVGNTAHVNLSMIASVPPNFIARSANLLAEVAWNRTLSVTKHPELLYSTTTRDGLSMRAVFSPTYNQVLPGLDIDVPVGIGYSPKGSSSAVPNFGVNHGGDFSLGIKGTYQTVWNIGLNYSHYFGKAGLTLDAATQLPTFRQALADRDFVSFSLSTTF